MVRAKIKSEGSANFETQECWLVGSTSKYGNLEVKMTGVIIWKASLKNRKQKRNR